MAHLQQENTFYTSLQGRTFPPAVFTFPWIQNDCMAFFQYFHCFRLMQVCLPCLPIIKPFPICLDRFQLILLDFFKFPFQTFFGVMQQIHRAGIPLIQGTFAAKDLCINERVPQFTDNIFQRTVFHIHTIIEGRCGQCDLMLQNIAHKHIIQFVKLLRFLTVFGAQARHILYAFCLQTVPQFSQLGDGIHKNEDLFSRLYPADDIPLVIVTVEELHA